MMISNRLSYLRIRQLRLLSMLGRGLTLSAAAKQSMMSAPAASLMLQEIESLFGVKLFQRDRRGVRPSGPGTHLVSHVDLILRDFANLEGDLEEILQARSTMHLGAIPQALIQLVPQMARSYKVSGLGLLKVAEGTSGALTSRLLAGEFSAAIVRLDEEARATAQSKGLCFDVLMEDEIVVAVSKVHSLARLRKHSIGSLADLDWVLPPPGSHIRASLERCFSINGLGSPRAILVVDSAVQSLMCAAAAGCAAAGPRSVVRRLAPAFGLKQLSLEITDKPINVSLVYRAAQIETLVFQTFRKVAVDAGRYATSAKPSSANEGTDD